MNPLPSCSTNVVESKSLSFSLDELGVESNNVVNLVDKPAPPKDLFITFDSNETIGVPDGPLYITMKIKDKLSRELYWKYVLLSLSVMSNLLFRIGISLECLWCRYILLCWRCEYS